MSGIAKLKERLAGCLEGQPGLENADIFPAWPQKRPLPLKSPAIAIGLDGAEVTPAGLGGYLGRDAKESEYYGSSAQITLRFDIFAPAGYREGLPSGGIHNIYEALCEALIKGADGFGVTRVRCGDTGWDEASNAFCLTARVSLRAAMTYGESENAQASCPGFTDFTLRSELIV